MTWIDELVLFLGQQSICKEKKTRRKDHNWRKCVENAKLCHAWWLLQRDQDSNGNEWAWFKLQENKTWYNILDLSIIPEAAPVLAVFESSIHSLSTTALFNQRDCNTGSYRHNYTLSFISNLLTPLTEAHSLCQNGSPSSNGAFNLELLMSRRPPPDLDFKCTAHS